MNRLRRETKISSGQRASPRRSLRADARIEALAKEHGNDAHAALPILSDLGRQEIPLSQAILGALADTIDVPNARVAGVASDSSASVNGIALCVKGRFRYDFLHHPQRLTRPQVRQYLLDGGRRDCEPLDRGPWVTVEWDEAIKLVADRFLSAKQESGPDALAFLSSAKCTNEENYLVQKLSRRAQR